METKKNIAGGIVLLLTLFTLTLSHAQTENATPAPSTIFVIPPPTVEAAKPTLSYHAIPLDVGGWFSGFAVHSSGRLYGFGDVFGVWRSDDSAKTWKFLLGDKIEGMYFINALASSHIEADSVAYGDDGGVYLSSNGGKSWKLVTEGLSVNRIRGASALLFHPTRVDEMWIAANKGDEVAKLWRSKDKGKTWGIVPEVKSSVRTISIHPKFPDQIWVGTEAGLIVSVDGGGEWKQLWGKKAESFGVTAIARSEDGTGVLATDQGAVQVAAKDWGQTSTYQFELTQAGDPIQASVMGDGTFLVSKVDGPTWASKDQGKTWDELSMRLLPPPVPIWADEQKMIDKARVDYGRDQIVQDPLKLSRWYITGGGAPAISEDGGATWNYFPNGCGIAGVMTYKASFSKTNPHLVYIPSADVGLSIISRESGVEVPAGTSHKVNNDLHSFHQVMEADGGRTLVAAGVMQAQNEPLIMRSNDGGLTWDTLDTKAAGLPKSKEGITKSSMSAKDSNDFVVLMCGITGKSGEMSGDMYRTIDGGRNFQKSRGLADDMDTGHRYHPENTTLVRDGIQDDRLYAAFRETGINRSDDGGTSWNPMPQQPYTNGYIWSMAVDRTKEGHILVGHRDQGPMKSNDGGKSWVALPGWESSRHVDINGGRIAILGQRTGDTHRKLYYSADGGLTWLEISGPGYRFPQVQGIAVDPWTPGKVFVSQLSVTVINITSAEKTKAPPETSLKE